uniref:Uncharacterized protein n=1 Tax=Chromera velia CCMP2878 TaxID=1169474 RepID=A0A0G4F082_9ALVE|eukprot:Cvel_14313.t1-p1 / transcript=Cvel_14313.t1 / gene=Cvel_14313 / organism=Chromera_velia_CCMP2878 / gene_product=hypothetical protein / transcript_product=hypothetical protein / location=Cvel_scaffold1012:21254-22162(+) / protein_length=303 / sequence_SO=supercontig / SO=protein_coding / is_pseudo=false
MGGLAEQEGKGIAYVDLKDAFFGKNPAWRQAKDPHGAFVRMVAADEICLQPCFRRKQEAAKASGQSVKKQTQMERWVCACVDESTDQFNFRILPRGRSARTKGNITEFIIDTCAVCTELCTDALKAYCPKTLARAGILTTKCNHGKREYVKKDEKDSQGNPKSSLKMESLFNRIRLFLHLYNLQRQQCTVDEKGNPPLYYYLQEWKFKWEKKLFAAEGGKFGFGELLKALREVSRHHGCKTVREWESGGREVCLFPKANSSKNSGGDADDEADERVEEGLVEEAFKKPECNCGCRDRRVGVSG